MIIPFTISMRFEHIFLSHLRIKITKKLNLLNTIYRHDNCTTT